MAEHKISGNVFDIKIVQRILKYAQPYRWLFRLLILFTILTALFAIAKPLIIQYTIDEHVMKGNVSGLTQAMLLLLLILFLHGLSSYLNTYLSGVLGQSVIRDVREQLFQKLLSFRLRFYDQTPIGRLVTRNVSDIESLSNVFSEGLAGIVSDLLLIIAIVAIMLWHNWKMTVISLSALPLLLFSTYVFKEKVKKSFNSVRTAVANLNTFVQEHISGMTVVQLFGSEEREQKKFEKINEEHLKSNLQSVLYYSVYFPVAEFISALSIALMIWYGAGQAIEGFTTPGTITAFIMYISMFFRPVRMIADRFNTLQMAIVSSDRIFQLLDEKAEEEISGSYSTENEISKVQFDQVHFSYNEGEKVLSHIDFTLNKGKTLAIVGSTGSGKSTITNLINKFYIPDSGSILINDVRLEEWDNQSVRSKIGIVLQDVFLFSDSIRNNITLGQKDISDETIMQVVRWVGAEKFIDRLPGGLDYNVMERGATLSVGQRQIIAFIRAMVYNPSLLILDEATASIDSETEELIQNAIKKMMHSRTSIIIAHRLSTIMDADEILVLEKGEIKERGSHQELLNKKGLYKEMYEMGMHNKMVI